MSHFRENLKYDLPASIVVYFVAVPLCLGIALASGAPLFSGLIAGVIGGIVIGALSGSPLGVSGPAAGLAVIVFDSIARLGSYEVFLVAVVLAGVLQVALGFGKAGVIAYYFPSSVIGGMLSGIGIIIVLKQLPHAVGYDRDPEGDLTFNQIDGENTFSELINMLDFISAGPLVIAIFALAVLIYWETVLMKRHKIFGLIQGPLVAVLGGILLQRLFAWTSSLALTRDQLVNIAIAGSLRETVDLLTWPNFGDALTNPGVYVVAVTLAVVASLETLLSVEATDRQDPQKRITPTNRELKAQGVGNIVSGLVGGLPITQVIVRSSANMQSGARSKTSTIVHGVLLLTSMVLVPQIINMIPLSALAAILLVVGYKLAKPATFQKMYAQGWEQFVPFIVTVVGVVLTDLLNGIFLGFGVAVFFLLRNNFQLPHTVSMVETPTHPKLHIRFAEDVSFLNKASVLQTLAQIPDGSKVILDASATRFFHHDVVEIIADFLISAKGRQIEVETIDLASHKQAEPLSHLTVTEEDDTVLAESNA